MSQEEKQKPTTTIQTGKRLSSTEQEDNSVELNHVQDPVGPSQLMIKKAQIEGISVDVLIDSGATHSFLSTATLTRFNNKIKLSPCSHEIILANGQKQLCKFTTTLTIIIDGIHYNQNFIITEINNDMILGMDWLRNYNPSIDWKNLNLKFPITNNSIQVSTDNERWKKLIEEYKDVFPDELPPGLPPDRGVAHKIIEEEGSKPVSRPMIRLSPPEQKEMKTQLDDLLKKGFIRPSNSPYAAPVLFAKKKDGKWRMCIDYRGLNKQTIRNQFPLPRIDELLEKLALAKIFSSLDLVSGYYQIPMDPESIEKTAFRTRYGLYEFLVLPFGLTNAPATFSHMMNDVFFEILDDYVVVYLDDILVFSLNEEDHEKHLREVLERLRKNKLYAKLSKCKFGVNEVEFLGHKVSKDGISVLESKTKVIQEWKTPTDVDQLRSFLGLANFYGKFVKEYAYITSPLYDLLKKEVPFKWTETHDKAFSNIKTALSSPPVLICPDPSKPYTLHTDASDTTYGAVLSQEVSGELKPIAFMSRKMKDAELNYSTHEKELLAIVSAFKYWRHLLEGQKTFVFSDHKSITFLKTQPKLSRRQARWEDTLKDFDYTVNYIEGTKNVVADALSRINKIKLDDWDSKLSQLYQDDKFFSQVINNPGKNFIIENGLVYTKDNRLCIPDMKELKLEILYDHHDSKTAGHYGFEKTLDILRRNFYWPKMTQEIRKYTMSCEVCQKAKPSNQKPQGELNPLPIPDHPWSDISMDFITALPKTKRGHDAILVVVDRLTKMAHFIPTTTDASAKFTANLFLDNIVKLHGLPKCIVSDRDSKFTSNFWKELHAILDVKLALSTAFHPQTDGQTERTNRTLEQMLRCFISYKQDNWDELLSTSEFAYNSHKSSSTNKSPFFLNYGREIEIPSSLPVKNSNVQAACDFASEIQIALKETKDNLIKAIHRQEQYANFSRREEEFEVDDLVLLNSKNISIPEGRVKKLANKYYGPFKITQIISKTAYKIELPVGWNMHPVFHVSKLKKFIQDESREQSERPDPIIIDNEPEYEIEGILDHRTRYKHKEYLILWKGYPLEDASWVKESDLDNAKETLQKYLDSLKGEEL